MTHILIGLLAGVCFAGFSGARSAEPQPRRGKKEEVPDPLGRATLVLQSAEYYAAHRHQQPARRGSTEFVLMRDGNRPLVDYMPLSR